MSNQNPSNYPGSFYPYQNQPTQDNSEKRQSEFEKVVPSRMGRAWSSLQFRPRATFATQNQDEVIYVMSRRHWIVNFGWITRNILYSLIPPLVIWILALLAIPIPTGDSANKIYAIMILAFYSVILTNVVRDFFDWYFDPYIVTNERILDFTFNPFTNYSVSESPLENIESVKQNTKGFLGTFFNYGDITIETAATKQIMVFESAANPSRVRDIISDLAKVAKTYSYGD